MQPVRDHGEGWTLFFIAFMVVGSFFIINLFVGVVIDNFNRMKEEMGEDMWLTEAQREWVRTQELMLHIKPQKQFEPPAAPARKIAFRVVNSNIFEVQHQTNTHTHSHTHVCVVLITQPPCCPLPAARVSSWPVSLPTLWSCPWSSLVWMRATLPSWPPPT